MIINHNISALNTHRQLGANNNAVQGSLEKLSSGLKINRAGDDAAGLAISEKMRGQIRGLDMATKNAQDGISLIQTAEGALTETHAILQRMNELAVQSSNDTNVNANDREALQAELDELVKEINDISTRTEFNTQKLIDGSFEDKVFHIGANKGQSITVNIESMNANKIGLNTAAKDVTEVAAGDLDTTLAASKFAGADNLSDITGAYTGEGDELVAVEFNGNVYAVEDLSDGEIAYSFDATTAPSGSTNIDASSGYTAVTALADKQAAVAGTDLANLSDADLGALTILEDDNNAGDFVVQIGATNATSVSVAEAGGAVTSGATIVLAEGAQTLTAVVDSKDATKTNLETASLSISNQSNADKAIEIIQNATNVVSTQRAALGAVQNRLEHTINNLGASSENLTAAEARIRDTDMAKEMMEFTKNNILTQAAQAMLAQANQTPQGVLQLLR